MKYHFPPRAILDWIFWSCRAAAMLALAYIIFTSDVTTQVEACVPLTWLTYVSCREVWK